MRWQVQEQTAIDPISTATYLFIHTHSPLFHPTQHFPNIPPKTPPQPPTTNHRLPTTNYNIPLLMFCILSSKSPRCDTSSNLSHSINEKPGTKTTPTLTQERESSNSRRNSSQILCNTHQTPHGLSCSARRKNTKTKTQSKPRGIYLQFFSSWQAQLHTSCVGCPESFIKAHADLSHFTYAQTQAMHLSS